MLPATCVLASFLGLAPGLAASAPVAAPPALLAVNAAPARLPLVAIQPLGEVDPTLIRAIETRLGARFAARIVVLPGEPLPASAFYVPRQRYRGEKILDRLEASTPTWVTKVVGLMSHDLSATKGAIFDWGIFGIAGLGRRAAVVSVHRLQRRGASRELVVRRVCQVTTHELGHTLGLPHCGSPRCIMNDAHGAMSTVDHSSGEFCPRCRRRLGAMLRNPSEP